MYLAISPVFVPDLSTTVQYNFAAKDNFVYQPVFLAWIFPYRKTRTCKCVKEGGVCEFL